MISLLSEFERDIAPLLSDPQLIESFKRSCREKINGITFEAIELMRLEPGEHLNAHAVDLAEKLTFDANGGQPKP